VTCTADIVSIIIGCSGGSSNIPVYRKHLDSHTSEFEVCSLALTIITSLYSQNKTVHVYVYFTTKTPPRDSKEAWFCLTARSTAKVLPSLSPEPTAPFSGAPHSFFITLSFVPSYFSCWLIHSLNFDILLYSSKTLLPTQTKDSACDSCVGSTFSLCLSHILLF